MVEALFVRGLEGKLSPLAHAHLRRLGLDVARPLDAAYPFPLWMEAVRVAAHDLYPTLEADQAYEQLGMTSLRGLAETLVGRALLATLKLLGPERTLLQAKRAFRSTNNFCDFAHKKLGPGHFHVWTNEVGHCPTFTGGLLRQCLEFVGAQDVVVEVMRYDGHGCTFDVRWSEPP
jgi:uncharacterized protein (TIGR02265 family)